MKRTMVFILCVVGMISSSATAQKPSDNAALRYWMAFAQMNDSPISSEDATHMEAIVNGTAPWDEQKFGPLVEKNKEAIETMIRGTNLRYCEWGIEYDLGPDAPIAHLLKARVLARLNRLYAKHLASSGDYDGAIRATIAGLRFAQHMAENASFFGALMATAGLKPQLREVKELAWSGSLSPAQLAALRNATKTLSDGGVSWPSAARMEGGAMHQAMIALSHAPDPKAVFEKWFSRPAPANLRVPDQKDVADLDRTMTLYEKLLGMPPEAANAELPALEQQIAALNPVAQMAMPSPARIIAAREEVINLQHETASALGIR
jgi:hypothetical protein